MADELTRLVGSNIRAFRKRLSLTQEAFGELAKLSTPYVNRLEAGEKFPSTAAILRLAKVLGVRPFELFVDPIVDSLQPERREPLAVTNDFIAKFTAVAHTFAEDYLAKAKK